MKNEMNLRDFAQLSINGKFAGTVECNLELEVDREIWKAYEVSVSNGDLLFFADRGTATYVVDNYGGDARLELFDWNRD